MMKRRIWCCFVMVLQILSWVSATSRPFAALDDSHGVHHPGTGQKPLSSSQVNLGSKQRMEGGVSEEAYYYGRRARKIGSSPPSCDHKCYGCIPCVAIQVPTTSSHVGIQYTNYEPEGWRCKCGPSLYSP